MSGSASVLLSVLMIAAFLLTAGGMYLIASGRERRKGVLMVIAAIVMAGKVLIWTL